VTDAGPFALVVLLAAAGGLVVVLSNRLTERVRVPSPALVLAGAAVAVKVVPALHEPPHLLVERVATVALVCILFDGGMQIGWSRFRSSAVPVTVTGGGGDLRNRGGVRIARARGVRSGLVCRGAAGHGGGADGPGSLVLRPGKRKIADRGDVILKGESGANDPVGIALMASLIAAGGLSAWVFARVGGEFLLQMGVGAAVGGAGETALLWFMQRVPLPGEGLYSLRTLACSLLLFAVATLAHGSGFLAVFTAGIVLGDGRAPYKRDIERFHSALASLAEIVAFMVLGLTISLDTVSRADVWVPGLILGRCWRLSSGPSWSGCAWPRPG